MKFARFSRLLLEINPSRSPNVFHSNFYSTTAMPSRTLIKPPEGPTAELYRRISPTWDRTISIVPILDQWVEEGRSVDEQVLKHIINQLRNRNRYNHALQISMWMTDKRWFELTSSDAAIRLQLISKTQGIEQAEIYYNNLSRKLKDVKVYCELLNCYVSALCVEKAEAVMQKIKGLGYAKKAWEYNLMLILYYKTGNMEKLDALLQEMEEKGIVHNKYTLRILLSAYAAVTDIEKMDKIVKVMESDPNHVLDWATCTTAAAGYRKVGLLDKAFEMLKKAEAHVPTNGHFAYNNLLTQYATIGRKDEVLRVWSLYKKKFKVYNHGYKCVLKSLVILGDIETAEEIFDEWELRGLTYDMNIPNVMIHAYSKKGLFEKAEAVIDRAISKGGKPDSWTWYRMATVYLEKDQPQKAVEMMKRAIAIWEPLWKPSSESLAACLEHLKGVGDMEEAKEFIKLLLDSNLIPVDVHEKLLNAIQDDKSV